MHDAVVVGIAEDVVLEEAVLEDVVAVDKVAVEVADEEVGVEDEIAEDKELDNVLWVLLLVVLEDDRSIELCEEVEED